MRECWIFLLLFLANSLLSAEEVRSPAEFLGRNTGADFHLADWKQVAGYYEELARTSPRVILKQAGQTTEGRTLLYAVISSEENLQNLEAIRQQASWIADPRRCTAEQLHSAVQQGPVTLFITPSMHSDEPASTEMGMQLAWQLATSQIAPWPEIRERVVTVLLPSQNPDGVDHIVSWYRQNLGTSEEGSSTLTLYQYYTGHDNNRDWFSLTQRESQLLTKLLYKEWFPQVLWDVHQYGSQRERFFVPPYRDPLNPNLDPGIVAGINALGNRAILDMTRAGLKGIATGVSYDNWWNGGNRSVPCRHNIIGLLTEAAPVNIASPVFLKASDLKDPLGRDAYRSSNQFLAPWEGGWWRLGDIHRYQLEFAQSLLSSLAREPALWLQNTADAAQRVIAAGQQGSPRGWILPTDQDDLATVRRFVELLLDSGVELHRLEQDARIDHRVYPRGTLVIRRDQPYGNYVKDLVEYKEFPEGETPYDVAGWTLPALFGLRIVEVRETLQGPLEKLANADAALAGFSGDLRLRNAPPNSLSTRDLATWGKLARLLSDNAPQAFLASGDSAGLIVPARTLPRPLEPGQGQVFERMPRIGVYAPWRPSMDEGWLRWVLDNSAIPFLTIRNETLRAGKLNDILDVLILADIPENILDHGRTSLDSELPYTGGLEPEGLLTLEHFVRTGGKLIACGSAAEWLARQWRLPLKDVTTTKDFLCTGSVLRARVHRDELTAGLPSELSLMFARSHAWDLLDQPTPGPDGGEAAGPFRTHLSLPNGNLLLSGHIARPEVIEGKSLWVSGSWDQGTIHLFGVRPYYRAWTQVGFPLIFRAIFLDARKE